MNREGQRLHPRIGHLWWHYAYSNEKGLFRRVRSSNMVLSRGLIKQHWKSHKPQTEVHVKDFALIRVGHGGCGIPIPKMSPQNSCDCQKLEKQGIRYSHKGPILAPSWIPYTRFKILLNTESLKTLAALAWSITWRYVDKKHQETMILIIVSCKH